MISLPKRKVDDLVKRLGALPLGRKTTTVREVLVQAGKLRLAAYVVRPGRFFVRRFLQLSGLYLNGEKLAGGGKTVGASNNRHVGGSTAIEWHKLPPSPFDCPRVRRNNGGGPHKIAGDLGGVGKSRIAAC